METGGPGRGDPGAFGARLTTGCGLATDYRLRGTLHVCACLGSGPELQRWEGAKGNRRVRAHGRPPGYGPMGYGCTLRDFTHVAYGSNKVRYAGTVHTLTTAGQRAMGLWPHRKVCDKRNAVSATH